MVELAKIQEYLGRGGFEIIIGASTDSFFQYHNPNTRLGAVIECGGDNVLL